MTTASPSGFEFSRDTFAYPNELVWEYRPDPAGRGMVTRRAEPPPSYAHRCFVMARAARQFFWHARFLSDRSPLEDAVCRRRVKQVLRRSAVRAGPETRRVVIPGWPGLRAFSREWEALLKAACGGAWRSYFLRSHWRMVFPLSRAQQARTAAGLAASLRVGGLPIVHLVRFPQLTINHALLLFAVESPVDTPEAERRFLAYDPNQPAAPVPLIFAPRSRAFFLPANRYWAGGRVDVIHILRSRWF